MKYSPSEKRYENMIYNRTGKSGLLLPAVSLGLWYNFGGVDPIENSRAMCRRAFDLGITHFDLANNYGPPYGSAEETFGRIMHKDLAPFRDELVISSKAGYDMWPGPYGEWGSRKYLVASLDQSLERMGLDYVDIFYHHRPDPDTPLEETMGALDFIVRSGRALYVGISTYDPDQTRRAAAILRDLGTPCLIHQVRYNMFDRWIEDGLIDTLDDEGIGCIVFTPLAQGILTGKFEQIPELPEGDNRKKFYPFFQEPEWSRAQKVFDVLESIGRERNVPTVQVAINWANREAGVTCSLVGAKRPEQARTNAASGEWDLSDDEMRRIEEAYREFMPA